MKKIFLACAFALFFPGPGFAGETAVERICEGNAIVALFWAVKLRDELGFTVEQAREHIFPKDLSVFSEPFVKMILAHTNKGIELVWEADPKRDPNSVANEFYSWCLTSGTVPAEGVDI